MFSALSCLLIAFGRAVLMVASPPQAGQPGVGSLALSIYLALPHSCTAFTPSVGALDWLVSHPPLGTVALMPAMSNGVHPTNSFFRVCA